MNTIKIYDKSGLVVHTCKGDKNKAIELATCFMSDTFEKIDDVFFIKLRVKK